MLGPKYRINLSLKHSRIIFHIIYEFCAGVADEVESYPCPLCPERVFLTSFGLERHSTEKHPEHLQEILEHIDVIGEEWRRREEEIARRRDRVYATRLRQESIARHAIEQVANGTLGQFPSNTCLFESATAMESHLRAHKKNDDLKMKLLARYGPEVDFYLVISTILSEKRKRLELYWGMHIYSQRYVCKWCGQVTSTMTELNAHKADVHAMPPFTAKSDRDRVVYSTTCDQCGLRLVRPSLLVRHMLRVHSKSQFSCEIEAPGTCNYKIDVDCERITWTCCDNQYSTRYFFFFTVSLEFFTCVQTSGDCVQQLDEVPSQLQLHCDPTISSTDLVQELLVEPVDHVQLFVF
uniref:C2H2-type domain-containing protein n=1 Tax=Angiostrongylus cantonensis TaxID=6313 RepID=A0A158P5U4_ANGCA